MVLNIGGEFQSIVQFRGVVKSTEVSIFLMDQREGLGGGVLVRGSEGKQYLRKIL